MCTFPTCGNHSSTSPDILKTDGLRRSETASSQRPLDVLWEAQATPSHVFWGQLMISVAYLASSVLLTRINPVASHVINPRCEQPVAVFLDVFLHLFMSDVASRSC